MFTPEFWSRLDTIAGVPVELAVSPDVNASNEYRVTTKAPLIYARRHHLASEVALSHIEKALRETLVEFGTPVTERPLRVFDAETLGIDTSDDMFWHAPGRPYLDVLAARAPDIRITKPDVVIAKQHMRWPEFVTEVGEDAAVWAALNAAHAKPPFRVSGDLKTLASRRDENPLALIRRAHAASVIRLVHHQDDSQTASKTPGDTDTNLRATLVWANRVSYDTKRHGRTRPLTLALEKVAHSVIGHCEKPVSRTDSLALEAARTLFAESLACVNLTAPVPV